MIRCLLRLLIRSYRKVKNVKKEYVHSLVEAIAGGISSDMPPGDVEARRSALALEGNVEVGRWTMVGGGSRVFTWNEEKVTIGKFCSLAWEVQIVAGGEHGHLDRVSNYHFRAKMLGIKPNPDTMSHGVVVIGNDVWIGARAIILSGVVVGDGSVIAAGALLTKSIPPYSIAVGNPARVVARRFPQHIIDGLLAIKWWDWSDEEIIERIPDLYGNIEQFVEKYSEPSS